MCFNKIVARKRRHQRIITRMKGVPKRPRLVIFKSNMHIYGQLVDDLNRKTIFSISDMKIKKGKKVEKAKEVGLQIAKKALEQKISECVFDRNGYKYHGRVKALAEGAREGGLQF